MKKITALSLLICLAITTALASPITEKQARGIAADFMSRHAMNATSLRMVQKAPRLGETTSADKAAYFVFNAHETNGGYVIVAGDDRAPAVLGYSDRGTFDVTQIPEAMQELLDSYVEQLSAISQGFQAAPNLKSNAAVRPLVHACWSQNNPYNILLPILSSGNHAAAGCVATAMAQVMYYWQWPVRPTKTIPAYTSPTFNIEMPALSPINFNWSAMQDTYLSDDTTSTEALAAARLTLYCVQAAEMDFKASSSSATTTRMPLWMTTYFGYKPTCHSVSRGNYSSQEWADILYSEVSAGRPVVYSGSKKTGGHAFICDGYDGNGMFHINWGWGGQSNGYFLLNVLNPDAQGTGSASGAYGYILSQSAIIGIEPGDEGSSDFALTSAMVTLDGSTTTRSSSNYNFYATVSGQFYNFTSQVMSVSFGWGLYQGETMVSKLHSSYNTSLRPGSYLSTNSRQLGFGENITSGTYRIVPIYSEYGANNWRPCIGADKNYIEVTINGNNCTFKGYGTAGERDYTVNDITFEGYMHNGRPINVTMNLTNNGESCNELLYMFANGTFTAAGYVSLGKGETGDIPFKFMPSAAGDYTMTFSWNDDGSNPIATRVITVNAMPAADLSGTIRILNITDTDNKIITSNTFSFEVDITNNGTTQYDEDISVKLFKHSKGNNGNNVQAKNQHLVLGPGESTTLRFDMENVIDGWKYFVYAYYYSEGIQTTIKGTSIYTIIFPTEPEFIPGDVNDDGMVNISDVTLLIDHLLDSSVSINILGADINEDGVINITDVTSLIDWLLEN